jgi:hypothetical protein
MPSRIVTLPMVPAATFLSALVLTSLLLAMTPRPAFAQGDDWKAKVGAELAKWGTEGGEADRERFYGSSRAAIRRDVGNDRAKVAAAIEMLAGEARSPAGPAVRRVNAVLAIGELDDRAAALTALVDLVADDALPPAVRVAAITALDRQVGNPKTPDSKVAEIVLPALDKVLAAPPSDGNEGIDWLAARALDLLPRLIPARGAAQAEVTMLLGIAGDAARPVDARVRAAAALGQLVGPQSGVDLAKAWVLLQELAVAVVDEERARAAEQGLFETAGSGGVGRGMSAPRGRGPGDMPSLGPRMTGRPGMGPGEGMRGEGMRGGFGDSMDVPQPTPGDELLGTAFRRAAWRLDQVAGAAYQAGDRSGARGLGALDPRNAAAFTELAGKVTQAADLLDLLPERDSLDEAIVVILGTEAAAARGVGVGDSDAAPGNPAGDGPAVGDAAGQPAAAEGTAPPAGPGGLDAPPPQ